MTQLILREKILGVTPRRGRGPGWIKLESREVSSFDGAILQRAAASVGVEVLTTVLETPSKKDPTKTYYNIVTFEIVGPTEVPALAVVQTAAPATMDSGLGGTSRLSNNSTPYLLFDQADDAAIADRIKGKAIDAYVYRFTQSGQDVYGLGVDGAEACKRELARNGELIEEESVVLLKDEIGAAYFEAHTSRWALHPKTGIRVKLDTALGFKRQSKTMPNGGLNPFWFEQGTSKALRNAILRLTPEEIKQRVIEAYKDHAKPVKESPASAPSEPLERITTPLSKEAAHIMSEIRKLSEAMKLPVGMRQNLWDQYIGKGLKPEEADPVALGQLLEHLAYRSQHGNWPDK